MPRLGLTSDLLLSSTSIADDTLGTLVYNNLSVSPTYLKEKPKPSVVRYWMREGARSASSSDITIFKVIYIYL